MLIVWNDFKLGFWLHCWGGGCILGVFIDVLKSYYNLRKCVSVIGSMILFGISEFVATEKGKTTNK